LLITPARSPPRCGPPYLPLLHGYIPLFASEVRPSLLTVTSRLHTIVCLRGAALLTYRYFTGYIPLFASEVRPSLLTVTLPLTSPGIYRCLPLRCGPPYSPLLTVTSPVTYRCLPRRCCATVPWVLLGGMHDYLPLLTVTTLRWAPSRQETTSRRPRLRSLRVSVPVGFPVSVPVGCSLRVCAPVEAVGCGGV